MTTPTPSAANANANASTVYLGEYRPRWGYDPLPDSEPDQEEAPDAYNFWATALLTEACCRLEDGACPFCGRPLPIVGVAHCGSTDYNCAQAFAGLPPSWQETMMAHVHLLLRIAASAETSAEAEEQT